MYAAVEGKSPFERPDAMASLVAVLTDDPEPAPNAGPLRPVIDGLLRKDPAERLTVDEVAVMLDRVLAGDAAAEPDDPPADAPDGATRRLPPSVLTAAKEADPAPAEEYADDVGEGAEPPAAVVTAPDRTEQIGASPYPIRSIVIVAAVLLVLFGVFFFATFS
jgi:hypothetical protein